MSQGQTKNTPKSEPISVRLPVPIYKKLAQIAARQDRSMSYVIVAAVEHWLKGGKQ